MSIVRSSPDVRSKYDEVYQILPGDKPVGGRPLSKKEVASNQRFESKHREMSATVSEFARLYQIASLEKAVENKVTLVDRGLLFSSKSIVRAKKEIEASKLFDKVETIAIGMVGKSGVAQCCEKLATSEFVIVCSPIEEFSGITIRPESKLLMLNLGPFCMFNKGLSVNYYLKWKRAYYRDFGTNDFTAIQVPSSAQASRFKRSYCSTDIPTCELRGSCVTDVYFDANKKALSEKLYSRFSEARKKKIILYMPKLRSRSNCKTWASLIDLERLRDLIGDEYVVVFNYGSKPNEVFDNLADVPGFSKTINDMAIRELIIVADVIVGDYRDTYFESTILHKPLFSTAYDIEKYSFDRNVELSEIFGHSDVDQLILGPVVQTADDLARELRSIDSYDYKKIEWIRDTLFEYCDGNSTKRIVEYLASATKFAK